MCVGRGVGWGGGGVRLYYLWFPGWVNDFTYCLEVGSQAKFCKYIKIMRPR